jgi:hypothetical protein
MVFILTNPKFKFRLNATEGFFIEKVFILGNI